MGHAGFSGLAPDGAQAGVGVLHVVDGIVGGLLRPQIQVDVQGGVHRGAHQRVARAVNTDRVHEVFEGDHGACALGHLHGLTVAHEVDHLADEHLNRVRVVAQRLRRSLEASNVAVVVRTQHVNSQGVAAVELVGHVRDVAGDVGGVAVGLEHDAVLVVAEVGGAQPPRAIVFVQVAVVLQRLHGLVHGARFEQGVLVEVHVEIHAELVQGLLDLSKHHLHAGRTEGLLHLGVCAIEGAGMLIDDRPGNLVDVIATVTVLRGGLALRCSDERAGEAVDLPAVVVEVVLAGHFRAGGLEHAAERVAHRGPAGAAQMDRAGGVGGDEFEVDLLVCVEVAVAELLRLIQHLCDELALGAGGETQVDKARTGDLGGVDCGVVRQVVGKPSGELAWVGASFLGHLERDVCGVIAVLGVAGAFHGHGVRDDGGVEVVGGEHTRRGLFHGGCEFSWRHGAQV